jgi:hypothetical protein
MIGAAAKCSFDESGYLVGRGLFDAEETAFFRDHFMRLREAGSYPGDVVGVEPGSEHPLKRYPRMIHMHRWDQVALDWLLEPRLAHSLSSLLDGLEPFAVQTMLYFKPPGARGQAVHQDQYYLRVEPGTCIAAWMALDSCDEENGCLQVVPGSHSDRPLHRGRCATGCVLVSPRAAHGRQRGGARGRQRRRPVRRVGGPRRPEGDRADGRGGRSAHDRVAPACTSSR